MLNWRYLVQNIWRTRCWRTSTTLLIKCEYNNTFIHFNCEMESLHMLPYPVSFTVVKMCLYSEGWMREEQRKKRGVTFHLQVAIRSESDILCTVCRCPLSSSRKYYKRLRQSFTQFWAVMMITRNTIKRRHWRKVERDMREREIHTPCSWLGVLATLCLLTLLCYKSLLHISLTQHQQLNSPAYEVE